MQKGLGCFEGLAVLQRAPTAHSAGGHLEAATTATRHSEQQGSGSGSVASVQGLGLSDSPYHVATSFRILATAQGSFARSGHCHTKRRDGGALGDMFRDSVSELLRQGVEVGACMHVHMSAGLYVY